ncbi:MAG: hypothetical protein JO287_10575 [Pseudonocardiales bacterium]|nr:hypothetical protein [Pseudonocardiales bacterium]
MVGTGPFGQRTIVNAGSNTAADHLVVIQHALHQVPLRIGRKVLVRIDGAGASHQVVNYLHARAVSCSGGLILPSHTQAARTDPPRRVDLGLRRP